MEKKEIKSKQIFGISLTELEKREEETPIPRIVTNSVNYLKKKSIETTGIFRIPGNKTEMESIIKRWNKGEVIDYEKEKTLEFTVASLLKQFARDLPQSLLSNSLIQEFFKFENLNQREKIFQTKSLLENIPIYNCKILQKIMLLLRKISRHSDENLMNASALAMVFLPSFCHEQDLQSNETAQIISFFIKNSKLIFPDFK
ncbi:rho gtpase-activating protein 68f [Anaeramoeba ignava]|uniref:Rho gtpase-activating protein 68f n=1 Tax=Anaeramoeba ignava TaxID=1746090 RepID=A0A9Q0R5W1_ANAIG|nr:rho gtpase-activating protein 68f [Anaeramoeba ignava]